MSARNRPGSRMSARSWALSTALHAAIFALAWASTLQGADRIDFITYEVDLVSPPAARQAEDFEQATEELVVERPEPEPVPPEPEVEEVVPVEQPDDPEPEPETQPPEPAEEQPEATDEPTVAAAPETPPPEEPEVSGEGIEVRMEGLRRDYPEYYDNIIRQVYRCFRWTRGGSWRTTIRFWINRDGTAGDIEFETRSGNTAFDFEAMGAVDCASRGQFGPLPEDLPYERLPILFDFRPSGGSEVTFSVSGVPAGVTSER
jgi:hypothetical protein